MLNYYERTQDSVRNYIKKCIPEHLNGYDNGWLLVNHIQVFGQTFSHIYSWQNGTWELVGTHVGFSFKEEKDKEEKDKEEKF